MSVTPTRIMCSTSRGIDPLNLSSQPQPPRTIKPAFRTFPFEKLAPHKAPPALRFVAF